MKKHFTMERKNDQPSPLSQYSAASKGSGNMHLTALYCTPWYGWDGRCPREFGL